MPEHTDQYKRLPRVRKPLISQKLWQGPDHILCVSYGAFRETNKRFYYRDIQAITIDATDTGKYFNVTLIFVLALFGILLFFPNLVTDTGVAIFFGFLMGMVFVPSIVLLIANLAYGQKCTCSIHTAVQTETLHSLSRTRTANKFTHIVVPLIEQTQGAITSESIGANTDTLHHFKASQHADLAMHMEPEAEVHHEKGMYHLVAFLILLYGSLSSVYDANYFNQWKPALDALVLLTFFILVIMAIVRQVHSDIPSSLRVITWSALIFNSLYTFVSMMFVSTFTMMSLDDPAAVSPERLMEHPLYTTAIIFAGIVNLILSFTGLVILARFSKAYKDALALAQTQADLQADLQAFDDAAKGP